MKKQAYFAGIQYTKKKQRHFFVSAGPMMHKCMDVDNNRQSIRQEK